ncbi:MAG TPA: hypothetical protein VF532_22505 [Candidatus Angelobacter sp.]
MGFRGDLALVDQTFFTLIYGGTVNFTQDAASSDQLETTGSGRLFNYNFEGSLFPAKPYWLTVFANRNSSTVLREFAGTTDLLTANEGAAFNLRRSFLPSTFSFRQESSDEKSRFASLSEERNERRKVATYDGRNHWHANDLGLHYEWTDVRDVIVPNLSFQTHTAGATHRLRFGEELPKSLDFNFNYVSREDRQGLSSSALTLIEDLGLQHTKKFSTGYHYILSRFTGFGGESTGHTGAFSLQHRLYESVRSELTLQATRSTLTTGAQTIVGGRFNIDYRKKLSAQGTLLASLGGRYEIENDRIPGRTVAIFREQHVAHLGLPFRLNQPRVIQETITVSGEAGTIIFAEGLDYLVSTIGEFIEVDVLLTGRIHEGESLLIDYQVNAPPDLKFSTFADVLTIGPDFGWVYPYYVFENNHQHLLAGIDAGTLERLRAHTAGVRFRLQKNKLSALLFNEYRTQDSRLLPYSSLQFSQVLSYTPRQSLNLGLSLDEILADYSAPVRQTKNGLGRLNVAWSPLPSLSIDTFASLRLWRDSLAVNEDFQQGGMRLRWSPAKFTAAFTWDRDVRLRARVESREFRWFTSLVRRF